MLSAGCRHIAARLLRAACISALLRASNLVSTLLLSMVLGMGAFGVVANAATGIAGTGPNPAGAPTLPASSVKPATVRAAANPAWKDLSVAHREALLPLASEWDKLDAAHRAKWLQIGQKFTSMNPEEKNRIQERMRAWIAMTPEQRRVARDTYVQTKKLNTDQKSLQWQQYQQLPEEQKKKLADEVAKNKVAALPPTHSKPRLVPPIKSLKKPVLQQSVTPHSLPQPLTSTASAGQQTPSVPALNRADAAPASHGVNANTGINAPGVTGPAATMPASSDR